MNSLTKIVGIATVLLALLTACGDPAVPAGTADEIEQRIKPVAQIALSSGDGASGSFSAEKTYQTVCAACHGTGALGAPKFGDVAAWKPRIATGMAAIMKVVIHGKNAMPPRGGTTLNDDQLKQVAQYMIDHSK